MMLWELLFSKRQVGKYFADYKRYKGLSFGTEERQFKTLSKSIQCFFRLFLRSNIFIKTIRIQIGKNNWDLEACRKIFVSPSYDRMTL